MTTGSRKSIALHFLQLTASGQAHEAFPLYVANGFIHHNAYFKGDADTLMKAMDDNAKLMPDKTFEVLRALEDGDLVAVHSRFRMKPGSPAFAILHIFRFEGEAIAELWDFGQAEPSDMVNEHGMF